MSSHALEQRALEIIAGMIDHGAPRTQPDSARPRNEDGPATAEVAGRSGNVEVRITATLDECHGGGLGPDDERLLASFADVIAHAVDSGSAHGEPATDGEAPLAIRVDRGHVVTAVDGETDIAGVDLSDSVGLQLRDLEVFTDNAAAITDLVERAFKSRIACRSDVRVRLPGHDLWLEVWCLPDRLSGDCQSEVIVLGLDVTDRRAAQLRLMRTVGRDSLTGLVNRAVAIAYLEAVLADEAMSGVGIAFVDLDRFKPVNDELGHHVGDEILVRVARRLEAATRKDDLVARFGGDEFVVIAAGLTPADEQAFLARLQTALGGGPIETAGRSVNVDASVGTAFGVPGHDNAHDLLAAADAAMYRAKSNDRAQVELAR